MSRTTVVKTLLLGLALSLAGAFSASAEVPEPGPARKLSVQCTTDYKTRVRVDGRQLDWEKEVDPTYRVQQLLDGAFRFDWTGPNDASFLLWCRKDAKNLYFAVVGRDNIIVPPKNGHKGDRFEFWFAPPQGHNGHRMVMMEVPIWPAVGNGQADVTWGYGDSGKVQGAKAGLSQKHDGHGYFLEVSIPLSALGDGVGFAPLGFTAVQKDWDYDGGKELEVAVGTSEVKKQRPGSVGKLYFGRYFSTMKKILKAQGLPDNYHTPLHTWADVTGDAHEEWIGLVGNKLYVAGIGISGWSYAGIELNGDEDQEPVSIRAVNLDEDPSKEIMYRYRIKRASPDDKHKIIQEFVAVIDITKRGLKTVVHQEVGYKIPGVGGLHSKTEIRNRGTYQIVRFRRATGDLDKDQYIDIDKHRRTKYDTILFPWDSKSIINNYNYGHGWTRNLE